MSVIWKRFQINVIADLQVIPVQWIDEVLKVALERDPFGVEFDVKNSDA